jgi:HNH endonuclease
MAHFKRAIPAPTITGGYRLFRDYVRADVREYCAYCLLPELLAAGVEAFELDHYRPKSFFPQQENDFYNLYYSCHPCNRIKHRKWPTKELIARGIGFVDLCVDTFDTHFALLPDGRWEGLTPSALYTIDLLRLNRPHLIKVRTLIQTVFQSDAQGEKS